MIASKPENIINSQKTCESLGGVLAYYDKNLLDFIFDFGEKNQCPFREGMFFNGEVDNAKCHYYVKKKKTKIIKDFVCSDKIYMYFVCQTSKIGKSTRKTMYRYSTAVTKTVRITKKTTLKKNEKSEEKNYYFFYLNLLLTIAGFLLSSIAAVACLVSNENVCFNMRKMLNTKLN